MQIGIIGLPNSSKTTVFNALTRGQAETSRTSSGRIEVHTAMVDVPDPRLERLAAMFNPRKVTPAQVRYCDLAGLARGIGERGGLDGGLLGHLSQSDALLHVVRAFEDPEVLHLEETIDPGRDLGIVDTELILSDLGAVERRQERLSTLLAKRGGNNGAERELRLAEQALLERCRLTLEEGEPLRDLRLGAEEFSILKGLALVTLKPLLVVLNTGEQAVADPAALVRYEHRHTLLATLQGRLEMELAQMAPEEAAEFLVAYSIAEPGLARVIRLSYALLGLHSFFTVGEDEVRAWTIPVGARAIEAAGVIHSDLARGFIRAEVVSYEELAACGGLTEARKRGLLRLEGKDYQVKDGDVLTIRFNV